MEQSVAAASLHCDEAMSYRKLNSHCILVTQPPSQCQNLEQSSISGKSLVELEGQCRLGGNVEMQPLFVVGAVVVVVVVVEVSNCSGPMSSAVT